MCWVLPWPRTFASGCWRHESQGWKAAPARPDRGAACDGGEPRGARGGSRARQGSVECRGSREADYGDGNARLDDADRGRADRTAAGEEDLSRATAPDALWIADGEDRAGARRGTRWCGSAGWGGERIARRRGDPQEGPWPWAQRGERLLWSRAHPREARGSCPGRCLPRLSPWQGLSARAPGGAGAHHG